MISRPSILAVVRLLSIIACAAALRTPAIAATVTPASAADYIFHRPVLTNNIRGVVMGWPPAYRVIRSEDVDWILEAWEERVAIRAGSTNRNNRAVGAIVKRNDLADITTFWNGWPREDAGWLDGSVELATARVPFPHYGRVTTNIWTYEDSASVTNIPETYFDIGVSKSNGFQVITMPLANGLQSVFTNRWTWEYKDKAMVLVTATNIHTWTHLDWCQADPSGPFPGNMDAPRLNWAESRIYFPTVSAVSNAYQNLRSTSRLADVGFLETNSCLTLRTTQSNGVPGRPATNSTPVLSYFLHLYAATNGQNYSGTEEVNLTPYTAHVPTRFKSYLNTIGGKQRIALEAAYAPVGLEYFYRNGFSHSTETVTTNVLIRLSGATLDTSGDTMHVHVPYNSKQLCSLAATAVALPPPPPDGVMNRPADGETYEWSCNRLGFVFIYRITPSVKLPDW